MTLSSERAGRAALLVIACVWLAACSSGGGPRRAEPRGASSAPSTPFTPSVASPSRRTGGSADERFQEALKLMASRPDQAREALLDLSREYPAMSGPLTNLGILYAESRQRGDAVTMFSKAVEANPNNVVARNWLGTLYRETGDFARAEQAYRSALAIDPDYAPAHLNLGILYDVALGRRDQALRHYRAYQQSAEAPKLIVLAWIKQLEAGAPAPGPAVASAGDRP